MADLPQWHPRGHLITTEPVLNIEELAGLGHGLRQP